MVLCTACGSAPFAIALQHVAQQYCIAATRQLRPESSATVGARLIAAAAVSVGLLGVILDVHAEVVATVWGCQLKATLPDPEALLRSPL